jgi:hypothetical protein
MWETIKKDPLLRAAAIIILSILGFGFAFNIIFGRNSSGMEDMSPSGYSLASTLSVILLLAIKILLIVLVITAIIAVIKLMEKQLKAQLKDKCHSCGVELNNDWKCCPVCGTDKGEGKQ